MDHHESPAGPKPSRGKNRWRMLGPLAVLATFAAAAVAGVLAGVVPNPLHPSPAQGAISSPGDDAVPTVKVVFGFCGVCSSPIFAIARPIA